MTGNLAARHIVHLRAGNPGPFSLTGTNTWIVGEWVIDPGPALDDHLDAIVGALAARGGHCEGIALTHDHIDHAEAVPALLERLDRSPVVAAARYPADVRLSDGAPVGPLTALATPGHAPDHFAFLYGDVCFTGDAVLGTGSVFVAPDPGALSSYLAALEALRSRRLSLICPGHGPLVTDPYAKIDEYVAHRLDRERRLLAALDAGRRSIAELLDSAWSDVPSHLRPAAAITLAAHLDKLDEEGRLPGGVERSDWTAIAARMSNA